MMDVWLILRDAVKRGRSPLIEFWNPKSGNIELYPLERVLRVAIYNKAGGAPPSPEACFVCQRLGMFRRAKPEELEVESTGPDGPVKVPMYVPPGMAGVVCKGCENLQLVSVDRAPSEEE